MRRGESSPKLAKMYAKYTRRSRRRGKSLFGKCKMLATCACVGRGRGRRKTAQDVHSKWTAPICILSDDVAWVKCGVEGQGQRLRQRGCSEEKR